MYNGNARTEGFDGSRAELQAETDKLILRRRDEGKSQPFLSDWQKWIKGNIAYRTKNGNGSTAPTPQPEKRHCGFMQCRMTTKGNGPYCPSHGLEETDFNELKPFHKQLLEKSVAPTASASPVEATG
jgi:hypothetical protein